jgi:hypothetical protein
MDAAKDVHKEMLPMWAAFLCGSAITAATGSQKRMEDQTL